jgi:hypothetical protein
MSTRYIYNIALGLAGGFLVVAAWAFSTPVAAALTFAIAAGVTAVSASVIPAPVGMIQRGLSALALLLGGLDSSRQPRVLPGHGRVAWLRRRGRDGRTRCGWPDGA